MNPAVGDMAPDFTLENQRREKISLSDFRGHQNVLLAFHPLAFTPICSAELSEFQQEWDRFKAHDTHILGISVDSTAAKAAWAKSLGGFSFDLLSDFYPHGAVAEAYGVLAPEGVAERALFLVDKQGRIVWARAYPDPQHPGVAEIFAVLERM